MNPSTTAAVIWTAIIVLIASSATYNDPIMGWLIWPGVVLPVVSLLWIRWGGDTQCLEQTNDSQKDATAIRI